VIAARTAEHVAEVMNVTPLHTTRICKSLEIERAADAQSNHQSLRVSWDFAEVLKPDAEGGAALVMP
jgi:hypothetical protein